MPSAAELRLAQQAALYAARPRVRVLHCRRAGCALLVLLAHPDGTVQHLRVTTADHPELDALTEHERGRVRAAFLALSRQGIVKRAPWYADALALAAEPRPPYIAWRGHALLFAGSTAWNDARATRERRARAVTVLPPGESPASIEWPPVADWIVDAGDLAAGEAVEVGRCLIDCGARRVQMVGDRMAGSVRLLRAE